MLGMAMATIVWSMNVIATANTIAARDQILVRCACTLAFALATDVVAEPETRFRVSPIGPVHVLRPRAPATAGWPAPPRSRFVAPGSSSSGAAARQCCGLGNERKAVPDVETDRPLGGRPGANEHPPAAARTQVLDECAADPAALVVREDVGVADEIDVIHGLDTHHADEHPLGLVPPEGHPRRDLGVQFLAGHVRLLPAVSGNDAAIGLGGGVDDPRIASRSSGRQRRIGSRPAVIAPVTRSWASPTVTMSPGCSWRPRRSSGSPLTSTACEPGTP